MKTRICLKFFVHDCRIMLHTIDQNNIVTTVSDFTYLIGFLIPFSLVTKLYKLVFVLTKNLIWKIIKRCYLRLFQYL